MTPDERSQGVASEDQLVRELSHRQSQLMAIGGAMVGHERS
jgi:L-asparagine transporter-like permease